MTKIWKQVKRARPYEKVLMEQMALDETECERELFHEVFEGDTWSVFKVEYHDGYQLQAYRADNPSKMRDNSYHQLIARCGVCGELMAIDNTDYAICVECWTEYDNDY